LFSAVWKAGRRTHGDRS